MRVLDLFAGLGGWSAPFVERGHEVVSVDIDPRFGCTHTADVLAWEPEGPFDIVLASPPCEAFSVLTIPRAWLPGYVPRHDGTRLAIALVRRTVELIERIDPAYFVVENPRAMLRRLGLLPYVRRTVTYCQYGAPWRKPTDLWGGFPPSWSPRPMCRNGAPCHVAAPRGSATGVQGNGKTFGGRFGRWAAYKDQTRVLAGTSNQADIAALRAMVPAGLALDICLAAERDLPANRRGDRATGRLFPEPEVV